MPPLPLPKQQKAPSCAAQGLPCCVLVVSYEGLSRLDAFDAYQNLEVKAEHHFDNLTVTKLYPIYEYSIYVQMFPTHSPPAWPGLAWPGQVADLAAQCLLQRLQRSKRICFACKRPWRRTAALAGTATGALRPKTFACSRAILGRRPLTCCFLERDRLHNPGTNHKR